MKEQSVTTFLNDLVKVFLQNSIFYIPREIIFDGLLEKHEGEIEDSFFDNLSLLDINKGISHFKNEDAVEVNGILFEKRSLLEENIFNLLEKNNDFTPIIYQFTIEKYFDQLLFYLFCNIVRL